MYLRHTIGEHPLLLLISIDELNSLFDRIDSPTGLTNSDDSGLLQILLRQSLDRWRHRSREKGCHARPTLLDHGLAINIHLFALVFAFHSVRRKLVQDERQVSLEAKVDHAIGFIPDNVTTLREHDDVSFNDVLETTCRCNDDLGTGSQIELLFFHRTLYTTIQLD